MVVRTFDPSVREAEFCEIPGLQNSRACSIEKPCVERQEAKQQQKQKLRNVGVWGCFVLFMCDTHQCKNTDTVWRAKARHRLYPADDGFSV